jgi:glycosyltransferase involved in cell wall biosynthesis
MPKVLPLSVIVVSFNMERELPRTLKSLSPALQKGISLTDYEIIVVDNHSVQLPDLDQLRQISPNVRLLAAEGEPSASPVAAVNQALRNAAGRLVGVFIDGARMASPGLLAAALQASRLADNPAIGTLAFHLGPDVQMKSIHRGYNTEVEDELLAKCRWEDSPYRLFDISVFAGSSAGGWFELPAETNALFLTSDQWRSIGGFDPAFQAPGGGLVNLDLWLRVCESPNLTVIMLLGEATFHQVHGGIATNSPISPWDAFHEEYKNIRGKPYRRPVLKPLHVGRLNDFAMKSLEISLGPDSRRSI